MPKESTKILLPEKEMPRQWYNILPDLPKPLNPPFSAMTGKPATPEELREWAGISAAQIAERIEGERALRAERA